uniref:Uncharacterized protein n=1 Tax=Romanomermis culicivorax TaxID=13658 RepID=A0A915J4B8_ROMCU
MELLYKNSGRSMAMAVVHIPGGMWVGLIIVTVIVMVNMVSVIVMARRIAAIIVMAVVPS